MAATVLVLSEDSGKQSLPVVQSLIRAASRLLAPQHDSRNLSFRPLADDEKAAAAVRANSWKSKHSPERIRLLGVIASYLAQGHVVVFHVDTDRTWAARNASENCQKFEELIRRGVVAVLTGAAPPLPQQAKKFTALDTQAATAHARRLIAMHPCYSVEGWLFQSSEATLAACSAVHEDASHQAMIGEWSNNRRLLDEVEKPKEQLSCVADRHNAELVAAFPAAAVRDAGKSWADFVAQVDASGLVARLR